MSNQSIRPTGSAGNVEHVASYYAATANPAPSRPAPQGEMQCDICIVGAGFSGLSTALHLAEQGKSIVVLEAARVGWGASGRNGGQVVNGLNASLDTIARRYGEETAAFVGGMVQEGGRIIQRFVKQYEISCDLKPRNIYAAFTEKQMKGLAAKQALWRRYGMDEHELLNREELAEHVNSSVYIGGMIDHSGAHLHPLNLALGEAAALEKLGGKIYEGARLLEVQQAGDEPVVITDQARIRCGTLVLCGNAYLGSTVPALAARVMPVSTQMVATVPLGPKLARELLPSDSCVEDVRYILDYYRMSADHRLLFGGGTVYGGTDPADIRAKLRPNLERVFPALRNIDLEYAWSGNFALSFSRVPQLGRLGPNTYYAMGYSGHGVTGSHLYGCMLGEAISGNTERFDRFASLPWLKFPGGQNLRAAYSTAGSWWYSFRDTVGW